MLPEGSTPLTRIGSALPDLWSLLARRPLPLVVQRRLDESALPESIELACGIRSHLSADAAFHGHDVFRERIAWLGPRLTPCWSGLRHASLAAHVLVEMVLDGWIVSREPRRLDTYYACYTSERVAMAARLCADDAAMEAEVEGVLRRFASVQFLRDYAEPEGMVDRFVRLLTHTPFASGTEPDATALVSVVREASDRFRLGSSELLEAARAASDEALRVWRAG